MPSKSGAPVVSDQLVVTSSFSFFSAYEKVYRETLTKTRANDTPNSAIERLRLRYMAEATRSDIKHCTNEDDRVYLEKTLGCQESLFAPIRTLPSEVIILILNLVVGDDFTIKLTTGPFQCVGAIIPLTWICFRWREIIISQPSFWTSLHLFGRLHAADADFSAMSEVLRICLLRCGTAPLRLKIYFRGWKSHIPSAQQHVLDMLIERGARWKELELEFRRSEPLLTWIQQKLHFQNTTFPILEVLNLTVMDNRFNSSFGTFIHSPQLHTLIVSLFPPPGLIDLSHLTTLRIKRYSSNRLFADLLKDIPLLETLVICNVYPATDSENGIERRGSTIPCVRHEHLTSLRLNNVDWLWLGVWESVYLPKLTFLEANMRYMDTTKDRFEEMKDMLVRSRCVLKHVYFYWERNTQNDLMVSPILDGIQLCAESKIDYKCSDAHPLYGVNGWRGYIKRITVAPYNPLPCFSGSWFIHNRIERLVWLNDYGFIVLKIPISLLVHP